MTKQTKTIEDYPELDDWLSEKCHMAEEVTGKTDVYHYRDVEPKLLEMQSKIDELTEQNKELESFYALANELIEDYADYCSDTGALLPLEDQDSSVVVKAIQLLNKESK